jgi:Spy/CpxP family protein refolding chaperone
MRKTRIEILLISLTVLALGAGLAAGLLAARLPTASSGTSGDTVTGVGSGATNQPAEHGSLIDELGLTAQQRDQMREIWEGTRGRVHQVFEDAQQLQKDRDDAIVALLNDEQKAKFERISKDYADRFGALQKKRDQAFEDAVEKTKSILNDVQRQKYEQILRRHVGPDGPGTRRGPAIGLPPPDHGGGKDLLKGPPEKDAGEK